MRPSRGFVTQFPDVIPTVTIRHAKPSCIVRSQIRNWHDYNRALFHRGRLTVRFDEHALVAWRHTAPATGPGAPRRYADLAIEGVVRQTSTLLQRLAVDTHGYTHLGMAVSKLVGFDLCPRLKNLRERRLYVPREMAVPEEIAPIVDRSLSLEAVEAGWDRFVRLVASIEGGWTSAPLALGRFGAAARGDPLHKAGETLGKLLRSLFLCDYFTITPFRRELLRLLNHGELVHTLQRAIHAGSLAAARGRRHEELAALSGALTLLANVTIAWTTHHLRQVVDQWGREGHPVSGELLRHVAPVHNAAINFRGTFHFPLDRYARRLIPERNRRTVPS